MESNTRNNELSVGAKAILALLPPLMFVAFGVVLIAIGVSSYRSTKITQSWPSTEGTVFATNIRRYNDEGTIRFAPEVDYEYQVRRPKLKSQVRPLRCSDPSNTVAQALHPLRGAQRLL